MWVAVQGYSFLVAGIMLFGLSVALHGHVAAYITAIAIFCAGVSTLMIHKES